jgi:hypothetical protein
VDRWRARRSRNKKKRRPMCAGSSWWAVYFTAQTHK